MTAQETARIEKAEALGWKSCFADANTNYISALGFLASSVKRSQIVKINRKKKSFLMLE